MATYAQIRTLLNSAVLKDKAAIACASAAQYILDGGGGSPVFMNERIIGNARNTLTGGADTQAARFMAYIALDPTIQANGDSSTDTQVRAVIDAKLPMVWGAGS